MRQQFQSKTRRKALPFRLLSADSQNTLLEEPDLEILIRQGEEVLLPDAADWIPLPAGAGLISLPGRVPLGIDAKGRVMEVQDRLAVAATLPQGYTRLGLPAFREMPAAAELPLYGYAAVAWQQGAVWVAAHATDTMRDRWDPKHFSTDALEDCIRRRQAEFPQNRIIAQLAHCALDYSCFTAQNMFYRRWEAGIPVSPQCNARCLGCISLQPSECCPSPQTRLTFVPGVEEISAIGAAHLELAEDAIISFGQGCEGEPSLQWPVLCQAMREIRQQTKAGSININSNAGDSKAIAALAKNGLDSIRISLNSVRPAFYNAYYRPVNYQLQDVFRSMEICRENGVQIALNLLSFPGITDRERELEALLLCIRKYKISMVQMRNLNIDPDLYWRQMAPDPERDGAALGLGKEIAILQAENDLLVGSFSRSVRK
ncbi:MAG: radical SAM protein [Negativicutes bacterium]|nr:radical SAM protein [Negativicutes bacterium]